MLPKKPRELLASHRQDRKQGEPQRIDPEDCDLLVGEGARSRRLPQGDLSRETRLETCVGDEIRVCTLP